MKNYLTVAFHPVQLCSRLDYQPLFGKMSPRPDPGDGGNRAYFSPGPTDRPWVSEDTFSKKNGLLNLGNEIAKNKTVENRREFI